MECIQRGFSRKAENGGLCPAENLTSSPVVTADDRLSSVGIIRRKSFFFPDGISCADMSPTSNFAMFSLAYV